MHFLTEKKVKRSLILGKNQTLARNFEINGNDQHNAIRVVTNKILFDDFEDKDLH